ISRLDREGLRGKRPADSVRRALVRAPPAVRAGVEVQDMLPGEVLDLLDAEGRHGVQLLVRDAPPHGLHRSAVQLRKINRKQRRLDVELDAERPITEEKEERDFVGEIRAAVQVDQGRQGRGGENALKDPGQREGWKYC